MSFSQSGRDERRPPATTTRSPARVVPFSKVTPVICLRPDASSIVWVKPLTPTPVLKMTRPSSSTTRRSTHSKVVRRHVSMLNSASSASGTKPTIVEGRSSPNLISVAPASNNFSRTSGSFCRSRETRRAKKAWLWRTCGAPRLSQSKASSAFSGIGVSSRSKTVT